MKVIIAGSRTLPDDNLDIVWAMITASKFEITEIVSGGAVGADHFGEMYATTYKIPVKKFLPDYNHCSNPKQAPLVRNAEMAKYADALIAIWDGKSRGTKHMIDCMNSLNKPAEVIQYG